MADTEAKQTAKAQEPEAPKQATDKQTADVVKEYRDTGKMPSGYGLHYERRGNDAVPIVTKLKG